MGMEMWCEVIFYRGYHRKAWKPSCQCTSKDGYPDSLKRLFLRRYESLLERVNSLKTLLQFRG